jgi:hypothetical protein
MCDISWSDYNKRRRILSVRRHIFELLSPNRDLDCQRTVPYVVNLPETAIEDIWEYELKIDDAGKLC